jgi:hypothetical protein
VKIIVPSWRIGEGYKRWDFCPDDTTEEQGRIEWTVDIGDFPHEADARMKYGKKCFPDSLGLGR